VCVAISEVPISGLSNILFLFLASANLGSYPVSGGQQLFQEWLWLTCGLIAQRTSLGRHIS